MLIAHNSLTVYRKRPGRGRWPFTERGRPLASEPLEDHEATGRQPAPRFTKGSRPGPGRPKGAANRVTVAMRDAVTAVFEDLQTGHQGEGRYPHFLAWAKANPTEFYRMAARQLPVQVESEGPTIGLV